MSISIDDLTTGETSGTGVMDVMLRSAKASMQEEFDAGRLTGANYGVAYVGSINAVLPQAVAFVLSVEKANAELELYEKQLAKLDADTALVLKQEELVTAQIALTEQQLLTEKANTVNPTGGITKAQFDKVNNEAELVNQKQVTELAQTKNPTTYVDRDTSNTEYGGGILGAQIALYKLQKEGFKRDAEQKMTKIYTDSWAITQNLTGSPQTGEYGLAAVNVNDAMNVLRAGMNMAEGIIPEPEPETPPEEPAV